MKKTTKYPRAKSYPCLNRSLKDLRGEEWREVPFTEGYIQVSNFGRVKSLARCIDRGNSSVLQWTKDKILSQRCSRQKNFHKGDYTFGMTVTYQFNRVRVVAMVRRLVYEAFLQPLTRKKMEGKYVFHKDGDGLNMHMDNLGLETWSELRKMQLSNERYIPPAFLLDQRKNRRHLLRMNRTKRKTVKQYSLKGRQIATFPSVTMAARKSGISISCIAACAAGKLLQTKGFVWRFENDVYDGNLRIAATAEKPVTQYSIGGRRLGHYPSVNEAARRTGVAVSSIIQSAKRQRKHAGAFVWRYRGDPYKGEYKAEYNCRKIVQYDAKGKKIATFDTIPDAASATGSNYEGIRRVLKGKMKRSNGFFWKYGSRLAGGAPR
jgi:hypothetical protein